MALTEATARAVRGIQPDGADPAAPIFGLTGETLANRIRAAARAVGLGDGFSGHSGRIGMAAADGGRRSADYGGPAPRAMEARRHGRPLHSGRGRRRGAEVADLIRPTDNPEEAAMTDVNAGGEMTRYRRW